MCPYPPAFSHSQTNPETELDPQRNASSVPGAVGNAHTAMGTTNEPVNSGGSAHPPFGAELVLTRELGDGLGAFTGASTNGTSTEFSTNFSLQLLSSFSGAVNLSTMGASFDVSGAAGQAGPVDLDGATIALAELDLYRDNSGQNLGTNIEVYGEAGYSGAAYVDTVKGPIRANGGNKIDVPVWAGGTVRTIDVTAIVQAAVNDASFNDWINFIMSADFSTADQQIFIGAWREDNNTGTSPPILRIWV